MNLNYLVLRSFSGTLFEEFIKKEKIFSGERMPKFLLRSAEREKYIPSFLQKLTECQKEEWAIQLAVKFDERYQECKQDLSQKVRQICEKTLAIFEATIGQNRRDIERLARNKELATKADFRIGMRPFFDFSGEWRTLAQIVEQLKDPKRMEALFKKIDERTQILDRTLLATPHLAADSRPKLCPFSFPYDFNRAGGDTEGLFINASHVKIRDRQSYILGSCPQTIEDAQNTFDVILKEGVKVIISLHQPEEIGPTGVFWDQEVLSKLKLQDGWAIAKAEQDKRIDSGKSDELQIIQKHLVVTKLDKQTRHIVVLHYKGWHDQNEPPNLRLVSELLDRKDDLSPSIETPLWINCKCGVGRTGVMALLDLCRCEIREQLKRKVKLEEVLLNIPMLLYSLRQQRACLLRNHPENFIDVYQCVVDFAESLKNKEMI